MFCQGGGGGGGGVQVRWPENSLDKLFFFPFFYSSTYFTVFRGVQCFYRFIREKTIIFQEPKFPGGGGGRGFQNVQGGPTFSRGGGGVQMLISIETHITCDFPGLGGGGVRPLTPLWIRTCTLTYCTEYV